MTEATAVTAVTAATAVPSYLQTGRDLMRLAEMLVKADLVPAKLRNAATMLLILWKASRENIDPEHAFRTFFAIPSKDGGVVLGTSANFMMGKAMSHPQFGGYKIVYSDENGCKMEMTRIFPMGPETFTNEFTIDDAKRAELVNKDNWRKYPKAMCASRCKAGLVRLVFPDIDMYTVEELTSGGHTERTVYEVPNYEVNSTEQPKAESKGRDVLMEYAKHMVDMDEPARKVAIAELKAATEAGTLDEWLEKYPEPDPGIATREDCVAILNSRVPNNKRPEAAKELREAKDQGDFAAWMGKWGPLKEVVDEVESPGDRTGPGPREEWESEMGSKIASEVSAIIRIGCNDLKMPKEDIQKYIDERNHKDDLNRTLAALENYRKQLEAKVQAEAEAKMQAKKKAAKEEPRELDIF